MENSYNKEVIQEDEFLKRISNEIFQEEDEANKELEKIRKIDNETHKVLKNIFNNSNFHKYNLKDEDNPIIKERFNNINSRFMEIKDLCSNRNNLVHSNDILIMKAIGQMYNGTLIDGEMSIRNGNVYRYRRYNYFSIERLSKINTIDKEIITKKLKGKSEAFFKLVEIAKKIVLQEEKYIQEYDKEKVIKINETFHFIRNKEFLKVNLKEMSITTNNIFFTTNNNYNLPERLIRLYAVKYYNEIFNFQKEVIEYYLNKISEIKEIEKEIKEIGGDFLLLANLNEQGK